MTENSWFSRGTGAAKKARKQLGFAYRPEFWVKEGETAEAIFLDSEPFNVNIHNVQIRGNLKKYTCRGKGCPLCVGDNPRFISVYRVIDTRSYTSKDGKKHKNEEKYYEVGPRLAPTIERINSKGMLLKKVVEISRTGTGTSTVYSAMAVGKPKIVVPKARLDPTKDYMPKSKEELQTVAELLGFAAEEDDEEETTPRSYMEEEDESEEEDVDAGSDESEEGSEADEEDTDADSDDDDEEDESDDTDDEDEEDSSDDDSGDEDTDDVEDNDDDEVDEEEEPPKKVVKKPAKKPVKKSGRK